jgi:hypothetical protein
MKKENLPYWASVLFSVVALVFLVVNISFSTAIRAKQSEITQRQSAISSAQALVQLDQGLMRAIAEASQKNNDSQLRGVLESQGVSLGDRPAQNAKPADNK